MGLASHLVIFTRCPRLGTGKRRLAAGIGRVEALRFQRVTLGLTLRRLGRDPRWTTWLAVTPDRSGPWPRRHARRPQGKGDLGTRMAAVAKALPPGPVLIVGGDIPGISAAEVARGFRLLGRHDAAFGPATDGGYWSVGLRRRPRFRNPFHNVRWSTEFALADTLANLASCSVGALAPMDDVDDAVALARQPRWDTLHARRKQRALTA